MTTATFPDGTVFGWFIPFEDFPGNGSNPPFQSAVGFGTNNPEDPKKWTCYKDNDRVLFTKDGVAWTTKTKLAMTLQPDGNVNPKDVDAEARRLIAQGACN